MEYQIFRLNAEGESWNFLFADTMMALRAGLISSSSEMCTALSTLSGSRSCDVQAQALKSIEGQGDKGLLTHLT